MKRFHSSSDEFLIQIQLTRFNQLRLRHLLKTKALKIYDNNILTIVYSQLKALYNGSQPYPIILEENVHSFSNTKHTLHHTAYTQLTIIIAHLKSLCKML